MDLKDRIQNKVKGFLSFAGYVLYIYNDESLNCKIIPLPRIEPVLRIKSTSEVFCLGKPSLFLEGKPLWIVIREIPFSIQLSLIHGDIKLTEKDKAFFIENEYTQEQVDKMTYNDLLVMRGYSASEIDAKIHSVYTQKIFRAPRLTLTNIVIMFLTVLSSCLVTYLITMMYYTSIIESMV